MLLTIVVTSTVSLAKAESVCGICAWAAESRVGKLFQPVVLSQLLETRVIQRVICYTVIGMDQVAIVRDRIGEQM